MPRPSVFAELHKRRVFQVAAIYGAVAWGVTEVLVTVVEQLFLPQWVSTLAVIGFVVGFPVAMFLAWTFDFTAEGIRRTQIASGKGKASIALSLLLLFAGTGGLFLLIRPTLSERESVLSPSQVQPHSVVVLPFESVGLDPRDAYLGESLSDELRDQLGRVGGIRVAARSSSRVAAERQMDPMEVSEKLRVAYIVEGSIRRQGGILWVSVHLIESGSGIAAWTETFERGPRELLAVQQAIAEAVVSRVLPAQTVVVAEPATRNASANALMLQARYMEQRVRGQQDPDLDSLLEAVRLYREATEADPESALAYSRLAGALVYLGDVGAAEPSIAKALALNPGLSEVQNTLGVYYWARGLVKDAQIAWAQAVELNPNNPDALQNHARSRWYQINFEDVREMLERAVEFDPLDLETYATLGSYLAIEGDPDEARALVGKIEELFDGATACRVIAQLWEYLGEVDKSIAWTLRARDLEPDNSAHAQRLAEYYADIGEFETAVALDRSGVGILFKMRRYDEMVPLAELAMIEQPRDVQLRAILAVAYNTLGKYDSAVHVLTTAGLPALVEDGWRTGAEWDGFIALMNARYGAGDLEEARELARLGVDFGVMEANYYWWWNTCVACARAVLGDEDGVHESLRRAQQGAGLPWDPILRDSPCFERYSDDPVYLATLRHYDQQRAAIRARLPSTLAEFGVGL